MDSPSRLFEYADREFVDIGYKMRNAQKASYLLIYKQKCIVIDSGRRKWNRTRAKWKKVHSIRYSQRGNEETYRVANGPLEAQNRITCSKTYWQNQIKPLIFRWKKNDCYIFFILPKDIQINESISLKACMCRHFKYIIILIKKFNSF